MSKLADRLRKMDIFNNYNLLQAFGELNDVAVEYHRPPPGRMGWTESRGTSVWRPPMKGKPGVTKEFHGKRSKSFPEACAWVTKNGKYELVPGPFGGHIPKRVLEKAKAAVK